MHYTYNTLTSTSLSPMMINFAYLHQLWEEKLFSDVTLIFNDGKNEIKVNVHKSILFISSIYFSKLLVGYMEQHAHQIIIRVSNVFVAYDIVASFYDRTITSGDLPTCLYMLEYIRCCDYWRLDHHRFRMGDLEISPEYFDQFIDLIDQIGYDDEIIKVINNNLPLDYDLTKFPKELINAMLKLLEYNVICGYESNIQIWDSSGHQVKHIILNKTYNIYAIHYLPINNQFASIHQHAIHIHDANGKLLKTISYPDNINIAYCASVSPDGTAIIRLGFNYCKEWHNNKWSSLFFWMRSCAFNPTVLCYSVDRQQVAIGSAQGQIQIFHIQNIHQPQLVGRINDNTFAISCLCYSPDGTLLISGNSNGEVKIWNVYDGDLIRYINAGLDTCIFDIMYSPNNQQFAYRYDNFVRVHNAIDGVLVRKWSVTGLSCITFSPDSKRIITGDYMGNVTTWNILDTSSLLINKVNYDIKCINVAYLANYDKFILLKKYADTSITDISAHITQ